MLEKHQRAWLKAHPDRGSSWLKGMLAEGFDVHHIDGDHGNNDSYNLILVEHVDHGRLHGHLNNVVGSNRLKCRMARLERGKTVHQMVWDGVPKEEMVAELGACYSTLLCNAKEYAYKYNKYWPISKSVKAYNMRLSGLDWRDIGEYLCIKSARRCAYSAAKIQNLLWPLPEDVKAREVLVKTNFFLKIEKDYIVGMKRFLSKKCEHKGRKAYILRLHEWGWSDVAVCLGYKNAGLAIMIAGVYAKTNNKKWPIPYTKVKPTHCPQGHEYNLENAKIHKKGHWHCKICANKKAHVQYWEVTRPAHRLEMHG